MAHADTTNGKFSVLGGNQLNAPVSVPVNLSGNAAALLGKSKAAAESDAHAANISKGGGQHTSGKFSVLGGNQLNVPISVPVNVCGNSVNALSVTKAKAKCHAEAANVSKGHGQKTSGKYSILGGNQANVPISVPINVCGNAAAVLGVAKAKAKCGAHVLNEGQGNQTTSGKFSVGGGNQLNIPVSIPANVCGNAAALLGVSKAKAKCHAGVTNSSWELPSTLRQTTPVPEVPAMTGSPLDDALKTVTALRPGQEPSPLPLGNTTSLAQGLPLSFAGAPVLP